MNKFLRAFLAGASAVAAGVLTVTAVCIGAYFYVEPSLPAAEELREVRFLQPLRIYSRDGRFIQQFGEYNRTPVDYEDIPPSLVDAFVAAEDDRFFEHPGIDYTGILRAAFGLVSGRNLGGGSTITQQVAREYFLTRGGLGLDLFVRKFKEQVIALRIERELTKQEILELFCNTTFFGYSSYGVVSAAQTYFGKDLADLTLSEMAIIAGIPQRPSEHNPVYSVDNARARRGYVLRRMATVGLISEAERRAASAEPIVSRRHEPEIELEAPYVAEMVRREMVRRFGQVAAYTTGLKVTTTVDSRLQRAANRAVRGTLVEYDERHGYRGPVAQADLDAFAPDPLEADVPGAEAPADEAPVDEAPGGKVQWRDLLSEYRAFGFEVALVLEASETEAVVYLRDGGRRTIGLDAVEWAVPYLNVNAVGARPEAVTDVLSRGDIVRLRYLADGSLRLGQLPEVQGAFVGLDPQDGAIVSLSGGFDYVLSNFNAATQSLRQPGSSFKPFLYSAALENGYTPATLINDSPLTIMSEELETLWRPENYTGVSHGLTRMREALVHSYNRAAIRTLRDIGPTAVIRHMRKFGFEDPALPRNLALALGVGGVAPVDLASAYAVFANGGFGVEPYFIDRIEDANGNRLYPGDAVRASPRFVCRPIRHEALTLPEAIEGPVEAQPRRMPCADTDAAADAERERPELIDDVTELYPEIGRAKRVVDAQNVYLVADMMRDVVRRGSGARAYRELQRNDLAGKTGTTNDRRDAWFAGFNSDIVGTAWVGFFDERPLGNAEQGGVTAIPMWIEFMREALAGRPESWLEQPPGILEVRIDEDTGRAVSGARPNTMFEKFRSGHVPEREPEDSGRPSSSGGDSDERIF